MRRAANPFLARSAAPSAPLPPQHRRAPAPAGRGRERPCRRQSTRRHERCETAASRRPGTPSRESAGSARAERFGAGAWRRSSSCLPWPRLRGHASLSLHRHSILESMAVPPTRSYLRPLHKPTVAVIEADAIDRQVTVFKEIKKDS